MRVFRLQPIPEQLGRPEWVRSRHKGACLVYAKNEENARAYAKASFDVAAEKPGPAHLVPTNPWVQPELVQCTEEAHTAGDLPEEGTVVLDEPV